MNASELVKRITFSTAYDFLEKDPEQNFLKLVEWLQALDRSGFVARCLPTVRKYASDPSSNWYQLARSYWEDVDDEVRKTLFTNFMINGNLLENKKLTENRAKYKCNIPWAIMMDPIAQCNLDCGGCCTASKEDRRLSFDEMDDLIEQGKALGTFFYVFGGGEPLLCREDLIALCNKHADCVFLCITNGLLADEDFADQLLRIRNMIPILTLEGPEQETDRRRGEGVYARVRAAAAMLRKHRLPFGVYVCCTAENCESVCSEAFFDTIVSWGAKAAWITPYVPAGDGGDPALLLNAGQRELLQRQIAAFRTSKPLLTLNFCCDGRLTGGCIAGGRGYCHVNADGEVEPCAFLHVSDVSLRGGTLLEAYRAPLFRAFHDAQPFGDNPLRPCALLDHPEVLESILEKSASSAEEAVGSPLPELCRKCAAQAQVWQPRADQLWAELPH